MEALKQTTTLEEQSINEQLVDCVKRFREVFNLEPNDLANMMGYSHTSLVEIEATCNIPLKFTYKLYGMMMELKYNKKLYKEDQVKLIIELYDKLKKYNNTH